MRIQRYNRILLPLCAAISAIHGAHGEDLTPAGVPRNQSLYVTMRDGVKIAVDVWVPEDLEAGRRIPALMKMTSYWRAIGLAERTGAFRLLGAVGVVPSEDFNKPEADAFNAGGYALVYVDARGSGASHGTRPYPFTDDELDDYKEIVDWIVAQPWSNGKVGALGTAYEGNAAELLATRRHPAVKAVAPLFSDFDPWLHLVCPGGVLNEWFIGFWRDGTRMLDHNDLTALAQFKGHDAELLKRVITGVKRVSEDSSGALLAAALATRAQNADVYAAARKAEFRDDPFGSGPQFASFSAYGMKADVEASGVPMFVWAGWLDAATVSGALSRFMTVKTPQVLVIGPWGHGGKCDANPFNPADTPVKPTKEERDRELMGFFDRFLKDAGDIPQRAIRYFTMGENVWKQTETWPPAGFERKAWYFSDSNSLVEHMPSASSASDTYTVDFTATTGTLNRWRTQADGDDVVYADRAEQDAKLLVYTSAPLERDVEITGSPIVTVHASASTEDAALFVYLERVAQDGTITYLTEGMLHARDRHVSTETPPYVVFGPYHSYCRADGAPLMPGEVCTFSIELIPTSVLLRTGDRIRVAIAGHDASCFARYPASGTPVLTVYRDAGRASCVELPVQYR